VTKAEAMLIEAALAGRDGDVELAVGEIFRERMTAEFREQLIVAKVNSHIATRAEQTLWENIPNRPEIRGALYGEIRDEADHRMEPEKDNS
jgi:hypothetical protein